MGYPDKSGSFLERNLMAVTPVPCNHTLLHSLTIMKMRGASLVAKFLLTMFIARFLDLKALGVYGLVVGISAIIPVVMGFGIINNFARTAVTQSLEDVADTVIVYMRCFTFLYCLLGLPTIVGVALTDHTSLFFALSIVLITFLEHANNDIFVLLNSLSRPIVANLSLFIRSGLWIYIYMPLALVFPALRDINMLLFFWVGGGIVALAFFAYVTRTWPWRKRSFQASPKAWLKKQLYQAKFLYLNDIANTASQFLDRYIISIFLGLELTGVYVLYWSIGNALGNLVRTGTITLYRPSLISSFIKDLALYWRTFKKCVKQTLLISVALSFAAYWALSFLLPYLKQPLAERYFSVYPIILAGFVGRMLYEVLGVSFYSQNKDIKTLVTGLYVLVASAVLPMLLIPSWDLMGAAWAVLLTVGIGSVVRYVYLKKG